MPDRSVLRWMVGDCVVGVVGVVGVVVGVPVLEVVALVGVESPPPPQPANAMVRQAKDTAVSFAGYVIRLPLVLISLYALFDGSP